MAKYKDGKYYRAMCKDAVEEVATKCDVVFLEYGNELCVDLKNIIKLPENLVRECISRVVNIKLESGKSYNDLNIDATVDNLATLEEFDAKVEDSRSVTINDSIVIFKK